MASPRRSGPGDTAESHAADTIDAGAGLVDADRALLLAREGAEAVRALIDGGVPFDRHADGGVALGREAAHSFARIVHAGGDATGRNLIHALLDMVAATPSIRLVSDCVVVDLMHQHGRVAGLLAFQADDGWVQVHANHVVLATGGIGSLWLATTNPVEAPATAWRWRRAPARGSPTWSSCSSIRRRCCRPGRATAPACRC